METRDFIRQLTMDEVRAELREWSARALRGQERNDEEKEHIALLWSRVDEDARKRWPAPKRNET